jgi:hypothetical protein
MRTPAGRLAAIPLLLGVIGCQDPPLPLLDLGPGAEGGSGDLARGDQRPADQRADAGGISRRALAEHWAPVFYQDSDDRDYLADYIVGHDFDGDHRSDNNWENLHAAGVDLSARIYYSVVETTTHWFILYADFHPRDWAKDCSPLIPLSEPCHENDLEGAMVVVRKDGSPFGAFLLLYTEAHNILYAFSNDGAVAGASSPRLQPTQVSFEGGSHVELYVESKGHGVCALRFSSQDHCEHPTVGTPPPFPGDDGIVYRYRDGKAETPSSGKDADVGYALLPLETTLWARRKDICDGGCTFDGTMTYAGETLGKAFDGDTHGSDKANPPWAWDDPDDGPVYRGDLFFRPAETVLTHFKVPLPFSKTYLFNPFL